MGFSVAPDGTLVRRLRQRLQFLWGDSTSGVNTVRTLFNSLLAVFAGSTGRELALQIQFLKVENEILRARLGQRVKVTPTERRRLLKFGRPLGPTIRHLITVVSPRTFARWLSDAKRQPAGRKVGRPKLKPLRDLIVMLARKTGWGSARVLGEIHKLSRRKCSRQFVANVLREHGFDPGPKRGEKTWSEFVAMHAHSLWQCDFLSKKAVSLAGVRDLFVLAFIQVGSRAVFVSPATPRPTDAWCRQQALAFCRHAWHLGLPAQFVVHDRDAKYGTAFDDELARHGVASRRIAFRAPNMQAFIERWILSIQTECLDHFLVFGEKHLNFLVSSFVRHYLLHRPHQGIGNVPLRDLPEPPEDVPRPSDIRCETALGGLLRHYHRKAA